MGYSVIHFLLMEDRGPFLFLGIVMLVIAAIGYELAQMGRKKK